MNLLHAKHWPLTPVEIIGTIAGVTLIRAFLENFSNPESFGGFSSVVVLVNYFLFFAVITLSLGIFLGIITKQPLMKTTSMVTMGLPIVWLAPIIDLIVSGGACMTYITSSGWELVKDIFVFLDPLSVCGITLGLRVEVLLISLLLGIYIYKKTTIFWKGLAGGIGSYLIIFFHSAIPGIIQTIAGPSHPNIFQNLFAQSPQLFAAVMGMIPWVMIVLMVATVFMREYPTIAKLWLTNTRIYYYLLIGISGMVFAVRYFSALFPTTLFEILGIIVFLMSIIVNGWLAVVVNDIADIKIDTISNPDRPLIHKDIGLTSYHQLGWIFAISFFLGASLLPWNVFVMLVMAQGCYALYSMHPLRLKRHFLTSSFLVGLAGLATFLAGYFLISPDQTFATLPYGIIAVIFITLAIISNTKDFKDIAGDTAEGIRTMPVVFGARKAGKYLTFALIGWLFFLGIIYINGWIAACALPWIILDVIVRKRIPEYVRFLIVFGEMILLMIVL
jgi:4-hydroxybenzoate polyprenyltransferase